MKTGNQEIDELHDEMAAEAEDFFKVMARMGGREPAVKEKSDIFLRTMKILHLEEEFVLQSIPGFAYGLVADHKKAHKGLEKRMKEIVGELARDPEEDDFLGLKREVRRLLASHIVDFDIPAFKKRIGKA